jgi:hypothetical protein
MTIPLMTAVAMALKVIDDLELLKLFVDETSTSVS